jgi:hypothetical protein|nr:MAG TPA: hypothetical protein [Caudoviricetes sp.]
MIETLCLNPRLIRVTPPIYGVCDVSGARGRVIITQLLTTLL